MKTTLITFALLVLIPNGSHASQVYMNTEPSRIQRALEEAYGIGAGVGAKEGRCMLCHMSENGGLGNINRSFGTDFNEAAKAEGQLHGGGSLTQSDLAIILSNEVLGQKDSDFDGFSNAAELEMNSDPASDINETSGSEGGGGCGLVGIGNFPPPRNGWLLVLPFFLIFLLRFRQKEKSIQKSLIA